MIILVAFAPIVKFLLGVSDVSVPYSTLFVSIILFVVIPLAAGIITRLGVIKHRGQEYFENAFLHRFDNVTTIGLLGWFNPDKVKKLLNIPDDYVVIAVTPIGYPEKEGQRSSKKSRDEVCFYNKL